MNTSLGNSIVNYISIMVAAHTMDVKVDCVVEGDDALIAGPENMDLTRYQMVMRNMGFNVKVDQVESLGAAGYCSSKWTQDMKPMPDARSFLPDLFWTDPTSLRTMRRDELVSAKMLSYAFECPYMPVMYKVYKQYISRLSKAKLDQYEIKELGKHFLLIPQNDHYVIYNDLKIREPTMEERQRYDTLYHLDVTTQLALEEMYDIEPANALELYFALIDGNITFTQEQYLKQVVHN